MSYTQVSIGRPLTSRELKTQRDLKMHGNSKELGGTERDKEEQPPPRERGFPFFYALVMMVFFIIATGGKGEYLLPSIVLPLFIWLFLKFRG